MKLLVQENGTSKSERRTLNFVAGTNMTVTVTDDPSGNQADIQFDATGGGPGGTPSTTVESETSFGVSPSAGVSSNYSRGDHTHGSPTNPVTAHEAAGDPHTGYRLESADHTHASTGLQAGTIDHGVLTGLTDNDHSQYILGTLADAAGDLLLASAADTWGRLAIGGNGTVLSSNGTTASWQTPGAASHPSFITHLRFAAHG